MRVIAGSWGGRALAAPKGTATRPTSDRVREALFSILGDVSGARVLDAYAGTGALGIEALSRGAASATFVESSRRALAVLEQNLAALGAGDRARVAKLGCVPAFAALGREGAEFDLVFVDPPYEVVRNGGIGPILELACASGLLGEPSSGARLVLEHASRDAAPPATGLARVDTRRYGDTSVSFYLR